MEKINWNDFKEGKFSIHVYGREELSSFIKECRINNIINISLSKRMEQDIDNVRLCESMYIYMNSREMACNYENTFNVTVVNWSDVDIIRSRNDKLNIKEINKKLKHNSYFIEDLSEEESELFNRYIEIKNYKGKVVRHFKGNLYIILDIGLDMNCNEHVIYKALYGDCKV